MAAKKKAKKKTSKKAAKKATKQTITGGSPPAEALALSPPPPPTTDAELQQKTALLDAIANSFNSDGRMVVARGDEAPNSYIYRRPTGIMELDIQLGGGWPAGGCSFVSGPDCVGKTWLMLQTMALQQRIHGDRCFLAMAVTEGGFPYDQCVRVGLRIGVPDEMILGWQQWRTQRGMEPYTAEDVAAFKHRVGDFRIIRGSTGEEVLTALLRIVGTKVCHVVCCDSLQGLRPAADAGKEMDETAKRAAHATMVGEFFKRYIPLTTGLEGINPTTLLMTQQVRANNAKAEAAANIQKYIKDWTVTGSFAAKHFKLVDLILTDGSRQKASIPGLGTVVIGKTLKWEFEKGKAGARDNNVGEVAYRYMLPDGTPYPQGVDFVGTVIDSGSRRGIIRKEGRKAVVVRPETGVVLEDFSTSSFAALKKCMEVDPEFELAVRREVLASAGIQCLYR